MILWVKIYLRVSYLEKFLIVAVSDGVLNLLSWANLSLADLAYLRLGYHQDGTVATALLFSPIVLEWIVITYIRTLPDMRSTAYRELCQ